MISSKVAGEVYNEIIDRDSLQIVLDPDKDFATGDVVSCDNTIDLAVVGVDKLFLQKFISDNDFVMGLVAIYHENRHVEQLYDIHYKNDSISDILKYSYYAGHIDSLYVAENYFISPREIDAELVGMYQAYKFCTKKFGKEKADILLCDYVNNRIQKGISFVHQNSKNYRYNNVDDIFIDMSKAYEDSVYAHRKVTENVKNFLTNHPDMLRKIEHEKIGYKQDKMMASLYLGQTRNKYLHSFPGLSKIDWSHETNFVTYESVIDKMKEQISIRKRRGEMADELMQRIDDKSSEDGYDVDY